MSGRVDFSQVVELADDELILQVFVVWFTKEICMKYGQGSHA